MPALIANVKGQARRVSLHMSDNLVQFSAEGDYRILFKVPVRVKLCTAVGAEFLRRV
jgi:hypothetical protein